MIAIGIIISFILEGVFTNLVSLNSVLLPLFTVTALTILYPYFNNNQLKFMGISAITGLCYDIIYTDSIFVNTFSFVIISVAIIVIYNYITMNIFNINGLNIVIIVLFKVVSYLLLCIVGYTRFIPGTLICGIYSSLIVNIIYGIVFYVVVDKIGKQLNIKKME